MRYTDEVQRMVVDDFQKGLSVKDCAVKYDLSLSIVHKWVSHLQKKDSTIKGRFQPLVLLYEAAVESLIAEEVPGIYEATDEEWESLCERLEGLLFNFVEDVLERETKAQIKEEDLGETDENEYL